MPDRCRRLWSSGGVVFFFASNFSDSAHCRAKGPALVIGKAALQVRMRVREHWLYQCYSNSLLSQQVVVLQPFLMMYPRWMHLRSLRRRLCSCNRRLRRHPSRNALNALLCIICPAVIGWQSRRGPYGAKLWGGGDQARRRNGTRPPLPTVRVIPRRHGCESTNVFMARSLTMRSGKSLLAERREIAASFLKCSYTALMESTIPAG